MKLYVIPVETKCNARCKFCITKVRKKVPGILCEEDFLDISKLEKALNDVQGLEKIEITGGGEPTLHPEIDKIIKICSDHAETQMYTNGAIASNLKNIHLLNPLCLSRQHHIDKENERIMGISYDFDKLRERSKTVKLSLLLHKSGINSVEDLRNYIHWARRKNIFKVVVRQMFDVDYRSREISSEFVDSRKIFNEMNAIDYQLSGRNPVLSKYYPLWDVEIEFEFQETALHADGKLRRGWCDEII